MRAIVTERLDDTLRISDETAIGVFWRVSRPA
jgi:hypothetical protein